MSLTSRQRLSLSFGLYVFLFFLAISLVSYLIFSLALTAEYRKEISLHSSKIIDSFLVADSGRITITPDSQNRLLLEETTNQNLSVIIFDQNLNLVDRFGVFEFFDPNLDRKPINQLVSRARDASSRRLASFTTLRWRDQNLLVRIDPLLSLGESLGVIAVGQPTEKIENMTHLMLLSLSLVGTMALLLSLVLGFILSHQIFSPIHFLAAQVSNVSLDRLDQTVEVKGAKNDDIVILSDRFNQMLDRLKVMADKQKDFVAHASHELKTPLARIISSLELVDGSENQQTLSKIKQELFGLSRLTDHLMILSRLTHHSPNINISTSLNLIIKNSISNFSQDAINKNIDISFHPVTPTHVGIDSEFIKIIFDNLISNAIKYTPSFGKINIETFTNPTAGNKVSITDTGVGLDSQEVQKVFDKYYRSDPTFQPGHGLGLSLVKQICDTFNVKIDLTSSPGAGSCVTLLFPTPKV